MGALADLRADVVAALDPVIEANPEWSLHALPVDAITPPAILLVWGDPWLTPTTVCAHDARLVLLCVSARLDPDPGIETLELLIESTLAALSSARIPVSTVGTPAQFQLGGLPYQVARVTIQSPITIGA